MSDVKLVKVDNWGIYFLQRLKHFFNRTDYCDLTLQFQDNAQLKVHRLVLSACTEYFELLERTCEMYEDCLVMPDDLQADVVVPIVNFMYTGQLEFRTDLLDRLCQTSEIMNMPVLTKLLNSHRPKQHVKKHAPVQSYPIKHAASKEKEIMPILRENSLASAMLAKGESLANKRSYSKAFSGEKSVAFKESKQYEGHSKKAEAVTNKHIVYKPPSPIPFEHAESFERNKTINKKPVLADPRPTRYELPEELDTENVFESSFSSISYTSQPLMVHPETQKKYSKRPRLVGESSSKKFNMQSGTSTMDIVECKRVSKDHVDNIFEDTVTDGISMDPLGVNDMFQPFVKVEQTKDSSQLFDQILDQSEDVAKVSIETPKNKKTNVPNLDHAKIISEVLKKYPHLVKSNKNIKLKILNTPNKTTKKQKVPQPIPEKPVVLKMEPADQDYTYEADVLDSKQAARLIALGAENIDGPWICLICGTPGRALQFTSYFKYRRHLVEVHNEKPVLTICEYCGHKLNKRNYLLHHMYTKHGIEPPPQYHFPKCPYPDCEYIGLSEALLTKHKISHGDGKNYRNYVALTEAVVKSRIAAERNRSFQCYVCSASFKNSNQLLAHIQATDHKFKKPNLQCIYCNKTFLRESNLYAHLQIHHKSDITRDGLVEDSDDESQPQSKVEKPVVREIKCETPVNDYEEVNIQYQIQQRPDGIHVLTKKHNESSPQNIKHKILNSGFSTSVDVQQKPKPPIYHEFMQATNISNQTETPHEIIMIDNAEYIMKGNKLIRTNKKPKEPTGEFILPDMVSLKPNLAQKVQTVTLPLEYSNISNSTNIQDNVQTNEINSNLGQPISIYVSNEEEYKALMSANHPIIFDADDTNKSLTVLTTPHGETLETTTIDLDNAQSNEMMVIQDGFPLNVSQAISTENQNIVVVYSNQVDQNKGYQLLSTQLDPQFVNSSAIITQNFETVTTSTPVMSAHVLGAQIDENWQANTIPQNLNEKPIENPAETVIQQTIPCSEVEMTNGMEQNIEMVDLPEVELTRNKEDPSQMTVNEDIVTSQVIEEPSTEQVETTEQVITDNISTENLSYMSVDEGIPSEEIVEETINTGNAAELPQSETNITDHEDPPINEDVLQTEAQEIIEQDVSSQNMETDNLQSQTYTPEPEENIDESIQETSELVEEAIASEPVSDHDQNQIGTTEKDQPINVPTAMVTDEATVEKIQSLASEWSEEDSETTTHDITIDTTNKVAPEPAPEIEESIENIQQEVDQFSEAESVPIITDDNITTEIVAEHNTVMTEDETELDESNNEEHKDFTEETGAPTTKIKSLLNDWEDNDQEEGTDENDSVEKKPAEVTENAPVSIVDPSKENASTEVENPEQKLAPPQDKIKSLVSDWDEEEEEDNK